MQPTGGKKAPVKGGAAGYGGATGTIVILDGRTKEVTASINGSRDFSEYRAAIDAALVRTGR